MDCKERILSNDYIDGVTDFPVEDIIQGDACYVQLGGGYYAVYQNRQQVELLEESTFQYRYVPKLYGLMQTGAGMVGKGIFDPSSLVSSGIRQLQGAPLNLRGRDVVIAIIDTGERVIIMSS